MQNHACSWLNTLGIIQFDKLDIKVKTIILYISYYMNVIVPVKYYENFKTQCNKHIFI